MINKLVKQTFEELEKAKKEAYPLYYKNVFNSLAKDNNLKLDPNLTLESHVNEKLLKTTKETTEFLSKYNKEIENDSKNLVENVENVDKEKNTVKIVKEFEEKLIKKLEESQKKIDELNKELGKAQKDLYIDTLTKSYNRKALEVHLKRILESGKNRKLDFYLMILDLDHFKEINDTYGHLIGDFVLIKFVQTIKKIIRDTDKIYRFGGDEFVILFNRMEEKHIMPTANKILEKIASTKLKYKDNIINLTTSIGLTCHKSGDTIESIFKRADVAVYKSKKTRNKVTIQC